MSLSSAIVAATCFFASAMLICTRYIAAAIYSTRSPNSFTVGLDHMGMPMVLMAMALFALGIVLIVFSWLDAQTDRKTHKN